MTGHGQAVPGWPHPRPTTREPVLEDLDWDVWLGPAAARPDHREWANWHRWRDFATGQVGNWAVHSDLDLLRRFRDQVLTATPEGRALVAAFYANSTEVLYHMAADPAVFAGVRNAIVSLQPTIRDMVDSAGERIVAGTEMQAVHTVAQQLLEPAGVVLRAALEGELERIGPLNELAGKTSIAVRQQVVGKFIRIVEPRLLAEGGFEFRVIGDAEASLRVESSDDLLTWKALDSPVIQQLPATVRDLSASPGGNRYYRVVAAP